MEHMDLSITFVYSFVGCMAVVIGYFIKHYVGSLEKSISRLNESVESIFKMTSQHETDHRLFNLKLEFQSEKIDSYANRLEDYEGRLDELETKVK